MSATIENGTALAVDIEPQPMSLPAVVSETGQILQAITQAAMNPQFDADKMERMVALYERMEARKAEIAFNEAMNAAQNKIGRVATDKTNNQTKSDYASYAALDRVIRPIYSEAGFSLSFNTGKTDLVDVVLVLCDVSHKLGHTKQYSVPIPADGKGAKGGDVMTKTHATGSAMQYGMRYLLKFIFNVAIGKDDDGNAAGAKEAPDWQLEDKQRSTLVDLMAEWEPTAAEKEMLLKWLKTDSVENIRREKFDTVVRKLRDKIAEKKA